MLRWGLGAVACLIAGGFLLFRYYTGVPALASLATVAGDVASAEIQVRHTRRTSSEFLAIRIGEHPVAYYLERFPDYQRIVATIKPGDRVTAWVDVGGHNYIWQLEKAGERLASYDQVAAEHASNLRNNAWFGLLFLVFGVGTLGVVAWKWMTGGTMSF